MDRQLVADILTGDSDEIAEIKANLPVVEAFVKLARELDALPETSKRFYEESRSLFQATCHNRSIPELETLLAQFFGPPVKAAGKPLPRKLRKNATVKYLGGVQKDQSLFLFPLKTGEFYGALWPWRRNKNKIEIHMGYCSDWMVDDHYQQLETLVKRSLSHSAFQQMDTAVGGQIRGIGLPSFLQMAEMEQSSFILRIASAGRTGILHVKEGQLIAAETGDSTGCKAAYHIISWDDVTIEIAPADPDRSDEIRQPLMHVLMESLKIKDEISGPAETPPVPRFEGKSRRGGADLKKENRRIVRLERPPVPKMPLKGSRLSTVLAVVLGTVVIVSSGLVFGLYLANTRATESIRYEQLRTQVARTDALKKKIDILQTYLHSHPHSPHSGAIESQITKIRSRIEANDFDQITLKISSLPVNADYERKAIALYGDFLEKYPNSPFQPKIDAAIHDIKKLLDQYYYEELVRAARFDFGKRLQVYKKYLAHFPKGHYRRDVEVLIQSMGRQHLAFLKSEDKQCEQNKKWDSCLARYDRFISDFKGTPLAVEAAGLKSALQDKRDLAKLRKLEANAGDDYLKAYQAFRDYLDQHPQSSQKAAITAELAQLNKRLQARRRWKSVQVYALNDKNSLFERIQYLDRYLQNSSGPYAAEAQDLMSQLEAQRRLALQKDRMEAQKEAQRARIQRAKEKKRQQQIRIRRIRNNLEHLLSNSTRFKINGDGTFTDQTTGLTWMLIDSYQELGGCLNYQSARQYVKTLSARQKGNWRLPTSSELAALYKQTPFFPDSGAEWYWTSGAYVRGYHSVAEIVTSKHETVFQRQYRRQDECGAVRAVR